MGATHLYGTIWNLRKNLAALLGASALAAVAAVGTGCNSRLYDENAQLYRENRELRARADERAQIQAQLQAQAAPASDTARSADLPRSAAPVATPPVTPPVTPPAPVPSAAFSSALPTTPDQPASVDGSDLVGLNTTENKLTGTMTVKFLGDELFDPGQAKLKDTSKRDLDKVVSALKKHYAGKTVRIEGHTDSDPIKRSKWGNNMELSKARADEVRKYLVSKGVPSNLVTTQGFGDTKPKSTDPAKKSQNRRVEIVVLAK